MQLTTKFTKDTKKPVRIFGPLGATCRVNAPGRSPLWVFLVLLVFLVVQIRFPA